MSQNSRDEVVQDIGSPLISTSAIVPGLAYKCQKNMRHSDSVNARDK